MRLMVVGLVALKESGKSTFFNVAQSLYPVQEIMLAGRLKQACSVAFGVPLNHFDDQNFKEKPAIFENPGPDADLLTEERLRVILQIFGYPDEESFQKTKHTIGNRLPTPRRMAQFVGTEVMRDCIDPDIHIKKAIEKMDQFKINIVTDIRFANELGWFKNGEYDFTSVHILRPDKTPQDLESAHPSEKNVLEVGKGCDHTIINEEYSAYKSGVKELIEKIMLDQSEKEFPTYLRKHANCLNKTA
ncbi:hypothetical protein [Bdellovibrio sp. BCCA]|uniref:hypothetical protein n=1 Tax=Bdellovibrio sp. BCCA TaxID=3136281 RepID=UPI0030F1BAA8